MASISSAVIAGLAVGIGLILLFAFMPVSEQKARFPSILAESRISQEQAIGMVLVELQRHFSNFTINDLYIYDPANRGWLSAKEVMQSDRQVIHLIFYHQNGTLIWINHADNTVISTCAPDLCSHDTKLNDRLVYVIEAECHKECDTFDVYYVNAINGKIIQPTFFGKRVFERDSSSSFA